MATTLSSVDMSSQEENEVICNSAIESRPRTGECIGATGDVTGNSMKYENLIHKDEYDEDEEQEAEDEDNEVDDYIFQHRPALWRAAMDNNFQYVQDKIKEIQHTFAGTAMPPVIEWVDERGQTVLHIACLCKSYKTAHMLLDEGADFYFRSDNGATPYVCIADPVYRAELKQKAFDVSPEGIVYWAQVLADHERACETREIGLMSIEDDWSEEVERMDRECQERERLYHIACRVKYIKLIIEEARYLATERIITSESMELCEAESKAAWAYSKYLSDLEIQRQADEKIAKEEARRIRAEEAFRAERAALQQQRAAEGRKLRYAMFLEKKAQEEEEERKREEERAAEEAREKYAELCRHLERVSTSQGERLKYDKPRRLNLYSRLRLGVHMASCNTVNHNSGIRTLDPREKTQSVKELPPLRSASQAFFAEQQRSPSYKTPMPKIKVQTAPSSMDIALKLGTAKIPPSDGKFAHTAEPRQRLPVSNVHRTCTTSCNASVSSSVVGSRAFYSTNSGSSTTAGKRHPKGKVTETSRGIRITGWYADV